MEFGDKKPVKPTDEPSKGPFKEGVESDKIIFSNKELNDKKNGSLAIATASDAKD